MVEQVAECSIFGLVAREIQVKLVLTVDFRGRRRTPLDYPDVLRAIIDLCLPQDCTRRLDSFKAV